MNRRQANPKLIEARKSSRHYLIAVVVFSLAVNLLYLASPLYMMQIYNRVIASGSTMTLLLLTLILVMALLALSGLDIVRGWIMSRLSLRLDQILSSPLLVAAFRTHGSAGSQPLRDFETFRQFIASQAVFAVFDLPWVPIYIFVAFLLHPWFGLFALACCAVLVALMLASELQLVRPLREANEAQARSHAFVETSLRNAEAVKAMGMVDAVARRWQLDRAEQTASQARAATWSLSSTGTVRFFRLAMQSLILGLGAYLAIERQISTGAMFAATFLLGRALQPVEQIVSSWRQLVNARLAYLRVRDVLDSHHAELPLVALPRPKGAVRVENLSYALPGGGRPLLRNVQFQVEAGEAIGIVGPSGAGKSTLARLLVGVLPPLTGTIRLDGADLMNWPSYQLGRAIGYLPQDVELFSDTIAANIARFQDGSDAEIIKAAQLAGVHEMILKLPQGYNTQIGPSGTALSGGYRQRIGLARAVYEQPCLVVLDEPSSNLDAEGDAALAHCLNILKQQGVTVFIVSHRPVSLAAVNRIALMRDGMVEAFGPRDDVARRIMPPRPAPAAQGSTIDG